MANSNQNTAPAPRSFAITARDSLESIVVAFALAFIFRAFIVEAFVIPTGSMAPTLYGQQVIHTCSTCGFEFARGVEQMPRGTRPNQELTLRCPNCDSTQDRVAITELIKPSSGDRILVHKWPFSVGGKLGPKRWDVTVFKDPHDGTTNYIKRLVGQPGEVLQIVQGDIYTASLDELGQKEPELIEEMDQLRRDVYAYSQGQSDLTLSSAATRYQAITQRLIPYMKIERKAVDAPEAQKSLWFNVYDRDYLPNYEHTKGQPELRVGWSPLILTIDSLRAEQLDAGRVPADLRSALQQSNVLLPDSPEVVVENPGREWRIATSGGDILVAQEENRLAVYEAAAHKAWDSTRRDLRFESESDRLLSVSFTGKMIGDFYAYNYAHGANGPSQERVPVGDLRLAFTWFPEAGQGGLVLEMNRHKDKFTAHLRMDGTVEVHRTSPDLAKPVLIGTYKQEPFQHGKAVQVEFTNVDFRVSVALDGQEVLASTDEQYSPDLEDLVSRNAEDPARSGIIWSQVRIGGYAMRFRLDHLQLQRDVYYRSSAMAEPTSSLRPGVPPSQQQFVRNPFHQWPGWGTQGWPIMLRDGEVKEYFMLGDNSPGSKDSRLWWEIGPHLEHLGEDYQLGTVPEDQMIGRAFFVYWPSGYRRTWTADIGIVPNFGRMRWIR